jgi:signal transduction histidine kinase
VAAEGSDPVQLALRLTGMGAEREGAEGRVLGVRNRIFSTVFDAEWVRKKEADRGIVEPVKRWLEGARGEDFLLSGAALAEVRAWAQGREDLTAEEREFLDACGRGEDRRLYREALQVNRVKDEFLATLSHELRTPLNAILGWARLLRMGKLNAEARTRALETIERNAEAQAQLIEDLLDASRILSGKLQVEVRLVDVPAVTEAALDAVRLTAEAKSIDLVPYIERVPELLGDPTRLQQVVWNLLSNAIKFTPKGGRVEVQVIAVDSHVEIRVADNGLGIHADFLPHVFDRLRQADGTTTPAHRRLGLGLAIVRHLVELHGGSVHARSEGEGLGAVFTVRLPVTAARPLPLDDPRASRAKGALESALPLSGLRVLVVDDEEDACELIAAVLTENGARVVAVNSVPEALEAVERRRPDVLLSDIGMPGEDGYVLMRHLRLMEKTLGRIPAAAVTAYATDQDRARALLAGYQLHLPKPIKPPELVAAVADLAGRPLPSKPL